MLFYYLSYAQSTMVKHAFLIYSPFLIDLRPLKVILMIAMRHTHNCARLHAKFIYHIFAANLMGFLIHLQRFFVCKVTIRIQRDPFRITIKIKVNLAVIVLRVRYGECNY